jgi:hypothetical protein
MIPGLLPVKMLHRYYLCVCGFHIYSIAPPQPSGQRRPAREGWNWKLGTRVFSPCRHLVSVRVCPAQPISFSRSARVFQVHAEVGTRVFSPCGREETLKFSDCLNTFLLFIMYIYTQKLAYCRTTIALCYYA